MWGRRSMRVVALLAASGYSLHGIGADDANPLEPFAYLAGHCWVAPFPDGKSTDTHCFEWVHDGRQLRDRHVVLGGRSLYRGETLYLWDAASGRIIYRYVDSTGGHSDGYVETEGETIRVPDDRYVGADGKTIRFVTEWRRTAPDRYEARTRQRIGDGLKEVFSFRFVRASETEARKALKAIESSGPVRAPAAPRGSDEKHP